MNRFEAVSRVPGQSAARVGLADCDFELAALRLQIRACDVPLEAKLGQFISRRAVMTPVGLEAAITAPRNAGHGDLLR